MMLWSTACGAGYYACKDHSGYGDERRSGLPWGRDGNDRCWKEGSGLGLSIAKNLTELQGGTFELYLDGDLFKVLITFPRVRRLTKEKEIKKERTERVPQAGGTEVTGEPQKNMKTEGMPEAP